MKCGSHSARTRPPIASAEARGTCYMWSGMLCSSGGALQIANIERSEKGRFEAAPTQMHVDAS